MEIRPHPDTRWQILLRAAFLAAAISVWPPPALAVAGNSAAAAPAGPVPGREEPEPIDLGALFNLSSTAATRLPRTTREAPASVHVITDEDIRMRGYRDLFDVLEDLPGVSYISSLGGESAFNKLRVRGVPGNDKIAILLNGRRIFYARPIEQIPMAGNFPLAHVKRIEVAFGPSSALHGADAMTAVVNLVTKDAGEFRGLALGSSYGLRNSTANILHFGAKPDPDTGLTVLGHFSRTDGDDFDRHPYYQEPVQVESRRLWPGGSARDASQMVDTEWVTFRHKGLALDLLRSRLDLPAVGAGNDYLYASNATSRWREGIYSLHLGYDAAIGDFRSTTTLSYETFFLDPSSAYVQNILGKPDAVPASAADVASRSQFVYGYKFGDARGTRLEQTVSREFSPDLEMVGGFVVEDFATVPKTADLPAPFDPVRSLNDQAANFPSIGIHWLGYQNYGAFLETQIGFIPNLKTTLGARYDYNTRYNAAFNPRLGLVYALSPGTTLKAMFGTAFLAPQPIDDYESWGMPGGQMLLPNPDLQPQRSRTLEVSALHSFGPGLAVSGAVYQNDLDDLIRRQSAAEMVEGKATNVLRRQNLGRLQTRGADLQLHAVALGQRTQFGVSLVDARDVTTPGREVTLPDVVNLAAKAGIELKPLPWLSVNPRVLWTDGRTATATDPATGAKVEAAKVPGHLGADLGARAQVTDQFAITLVGSNLLDQAWYANDQESTFIRPALLPQPGRRLSIGVVYTF